MGQTTNTKGFLIRKRVKTAEREGSKDERILVGWEGEVVSRDAFNCE